MTAPRILLAAAGAVLCGCGYPGTPLPPALNIPTPVTDLVAVQRGDRILLRFTPSMTTTDEMLLSSLRGVVLRGGPSEGKFDAWRWAETARDIPVGELKFEAIEPSARRSRKSVQTGGARAGVVETSTPVAGWAGKEVVFAVRAIGPTGRSSAWSVPIVMRVVDPLQTPAGLASEGMPNGVGLHWDRGPRREGLKWRVWRRQDAGDTPSVLGTALDPDWLDQSAEFGNSYIYAVQAVVDIGSGKEAESEISEAVPIRYEDVFPPEPPKGLSLVSSSSAAELTWERALEPDFASWQVWRAEGDGALEKLDVPRTNPSYSDRAVEPGKTYRYAVSAIDAKGNESKPCEPVAITIR